MLVIADPQTWAASQGYTIRALDGESYAVQCGERKLGALVKCVGGFKFADQLSAVAATNPDSDYESNSSDFAAQFSQPLVSHNFGLGFTPFEGNQFQKDSNELVIGPQASGTGQIEHVSDCNYWLPFAAEHYCLSRDIRDYVLVPIPAIFSDLPNTNGDSLSLKQMLRFIPNVGMQMYKTFKGKGTFEEHENQNIAAAKGVILESFLRPVPFNSKYYKIVLLLAYDRTKDPVLAGRILNRQTNAYSVGFHYESYVCSICQHRVGRGINLSPCSHTRLGQPTYRQNDGRLAYRLCENGEGFECSSVNTPAFVSAIGPHVYDVRSL